MTIEELHHYLVAISPIEEEALKNKYLTMEELTGYYKTNYYKKSPHNLSADRYMGPNQEIHFSKHYRFLSMSPHKHDFIEIVYVYKNQVTQVINGKKIIMKEGDLCILDTNVMHTIEPLTEETIVLNIVMRQSYFKNTVLFQLNKNNLLSDFLISALYKDEMKGRFLLFETNNNSNVRHYITHAMCEELEPGIATETIISSYILLLFSELLRISQKNYQNQEPNSLLFEALDYIEKNYKTISLTMVAEKFHYNTNYFSRLLKKHLGKSFNELILDLKMREVEALLKNTNLPIEQIITEANFSNQTHFYQLFKERHKMTPAIYRELD